MNLSDLLLCGLAAWRLASLLVNEDGPADVFYRLRALAGVETVQTVSEEHGLATGYVARNWFAQGLLCVWCVSVWTAALFVCGMLAPATRPLTSVVVDILAVSAVAVMLHETVQRIRGED